MKIQEQSNPFIKAIRLYNINATACAFENGRIPTKLKISAEYFFAQTEVDLYEKTPHPAPRRQYVITIKGKLKFSVSSGNTFILEPGIVLIAEDLNGPGHTWELLEGEEWERIYIPITADNDHYFTADVNSAL